MSDELTFPDIGPHEDRELELMLAGRKPLAMFTEISPIETGLIPEADFAPHVTSRRFIMSETFERREKLPNDNRDLYLRRVIYALPPEEWRINAMLLVCEIATGLRRWDEGLERVIGRLLGYEDHQIDIFVKKVAR